MRQLAVKVGREKRDRIRGILEELKAKNVIELDASGHSFFEFYLDSRTVQSFFEKNEVESAEITINPHGFLPEWSKLLSLKI